MASQRQPEDLGDVVEYIEKAVPEMIRVAVAESMTGAVRDGIKAAIMDMADDEKFSEAFWKQGFEQLSNHAGNASSQWVGKRILTALIAAVVTVGIAWLVKSGALK